MRDAIDAYLDTGGRCARFAGNFFWQVRFEPPESVDRAASNGEPPSAPARAAAAQALIRSAWPVGCAFFGPKLIIPSRRAPRCWQSPAAAHRTPTASDRGAKVSQWGWGCGWGWAGRV